MAKRTPVGEKAKANLVHQQVFLKSCPGLFENEQDKMRARAFAASSSSSDPLGTLHTFVNCVYAGITPPAYTLTLVAQWIKAYLDAQGDLSLDKAFQLAPVQRAGHPIKQRTRTAQFGDWVGLMYVLRKRAKQLGKHLSIEAAAGLVINHLDLTKITEDSLKKYYVDNRIEQKFDRITKILEEDVKESKAKPEK